MGRNPMSWGIGDLRIQELISDVKEKTRMEAEIEFLKKQLEEKRD